MAILNVQVDTEQGTCQATVNGSIVDNVDGIDVYNWGSDRDRKYTFSIRTHEHRDGVTYSHSVSAAKLSPAEAVQSSLAPDLLEIVQKVDKRDVVVAELTKLFIGRVK